MNPYIKTNLVLCSCREDVPTVGHYAIIVFSTITIAGDERSRTHPGHGYPAHSETKADYYATLNRDVWIEEIKRRQIATTNIRDRFVAFVADPVTIETKVVVSVSSAACEKKP